jgi:hypothetical protein
MQDSMKKRERRSPEELIENLQAKIRSIRSGAEKRKARTVPAMSDVLKAIKLIDRAAQSATDATFKSALEEARATLAAASAVQGVIVPPSASATAGLKRQRTSQRTRTSPEIALVPQL